ncbi:MAG: metallophosphatase family protein [Segetibacter sp.]|nr:metallophosphatase family protein [Segetibacter sp.]
MSRIAIFSDVHGNLPALETVLSDINKRNIDQVYCLGDLVDFAPWTNEVIELIKGLRISCLMGNHDERIAFDYDIVPLKKHSDEETTARIVAINYTKKTIANANQKFLKNLPGQLRLSFKVAERNVNILLVHASTRSNDEYIYESHDMHDLYEMLEKEES